MSGGIPFWRAYIEEYQPAAKQAQALGEAVQLLRRLESSEQDRWSVVESLDQAQACGKLAILRNIEGDPVGFFTWAGFDPVSRPCMLPSLAQLSANLDWDAGAGFCLLYFLCEREYVSSALGELKTLVGHRFSHVGYTTRRAKDGEPQHIRPVRPHWRERPALTCACGRPRAPSSSTCEVV